MIDKVYTIKETMKMEVYLKRFSRDFKKTYKIILDYTKRIAIARNYLHTKKEERAIKIINSYRNKIILLCEKIDSWKKELRDMCVKVCSVKYGILTSKIEKDYAITFDDTNFEQFIF